MKKGKLIVIEGIDGSGKGTQFQLLVDRLKREKVPLEIADFPRYGKPSAYFVEHYLASKYGKPDEVDARLASQFYILDRVDAKADMYQQLEEGKHIISNRYATSNMGHQGGKFSDPVEREEFLDWLDEQEYVIGGIPRPDAVFVLYVEPSVAQKLVDLKKAREYTKGAKRDGHEADLNHLRHASESYLYCAKKYSWKVIDCMRGDEIMSLEEIHELIYAETKKVIT